MVQQKSRIDVREQENMGKRSWLNQKFKVYLDPNYYEKILPKYEFDGKSDETLLDEQLKRWVEARNSKFKLALELGCGTGRATSILEKYCERVVACDLSPDMLRVAKERLHTNNNLKFFNSEMFEFIRENPAVVAQSDLVVSFWALNYSLNSEFADKDPSYLKFNAKIPEDALSRCMCKLNQLFDGLSRYSKFVFFHYDPQSKEQGIAHECWEKIVPFPYGKQTASLHALKKFFEEREDVNSNIQKMNGTSPMYSHDQALETYMNFHLHTLFNHSPLENEIINLLNSRLEKYVEVNYRIPAGVFILSGEKIYGPDRLSCDDERKAMGMQNSDEFAATHLRVIEKNLRKCLSSLSSNELNFEKICGMFDKDNYHLSLIKKPKWKDDSIIFKIGTTDKKIISEYTIKIHEDKYPLASHVYNNEGLLDKLFHSGNATRIIRTFSEESKGRMFRAVISEYLNGTDMAGLLPNATEEQILELRKQLRTCVSALLEIGVNVFVRDLSDFLVVESKENGQSKIVLTDYNAIMDCSNSDKYSRENVMDIIDAIIDKLISRDYVPFQSQRPTMIDLRF